MSDNNELVKSAEKGAAIGAALTVGGQAVLA